MTIIHYSLNNVISLSRIKNKSLDKNKEWQTAARCQPVKKYSRAIQARRLFRLKRQSTIPSNPGCFQSEMNSTTLALYVDVWFWLKRLSGRNAGACKARSFSTVNVRLDLPPATIRRCDLFISLYDRECFKLIFFKKEDLHHKSRDDPGDHCAGKATGRAVCREEFPPDDRRVQAAACGRTQAATWCGINSERPTALIHRWQCCIAQTADSPQGCVDVSILCRVAKETNISCSPSPCSFWAFVFCNPFQIYLLILQPNSRKAQRSRNYLLLGIIRQLYMADMCLNE